MVGTIRLTNALDNNVEEYEIVREIGSGTTGVAYEVRREGRIYAAKECTSDSRDDFMRDAEKIYRHPPLHFVKILSYGSADVSYEDQTRNNPLSVMEYGGSNLQQVGEFIRTNAEALVGSQNAVKAFGYKVLYTVLESVSKLHQDSGWHGDLVPTNILCGFDLSDFKEVTDVAQLEDRLIYEPVKLCDSSPSGRVGSLRSMKVKDFTKLHPRDSALYRHLLRPEDDSQKQDVNDLAGYLWWFLGGNTKSPSFFTGIVKAYDDEGNLTVSVEDMLAGVKAKLSTEKTLIEHRARIKDGENFPLVLRPGDAFRLSFTSKVPLSTGSAFNAMYVDAKNSYDKMLKLGAGVVPADEERRMQDSLKEFVLVSVIDIHNKYQQKLDAGLEPSKKKDTLTKKLNTKGNKLKTLEAELSSAKTKATEAGSTSVSDIIDKDKFAAYSHAREVVEGLSSQLSSVRDGINDINAELKEVEGRLSVYNYEEELNALKEASEKCPPAVFAGEFKEMMDYFNPNLSPSPQPLPAAEVAQRCRKIIITNNLWEKVESLLPR